MVRSLIERRDTFRWASNIVVHAMVALGILPLGMRTVDEAVSNVAPKILPADDSGALEETLSLRIPS